MLRASSPDTGDVRSAVPSRGRCPATSARPWSRPFRVPSTDDRGLRRTSRRCRSWVACHGASCTTTRLWPWRRSWETAGASVPVCSRSWSHYLFEDRFGVPARVTTRARWRGWWERVGTSWSPYRRFRASMRSTPPGGEVGAAGETVAGPRGDHRPADGAWWSPCCASRRALRRQRQAREPVSYPALGGT